MTSRQIQTWVVRSFSTLMGVRRYCHVIRTDIVDRCASERFTESSEPKHGIWLLWVGICTESSLNTWNSLLKGCDTATCRNEALSILETQTPITVKILKYTTSLWKLQYYIIVILSNKMQPTQILTNSQFDHFRTKITWPVSKYNPGLKTNILPLFVSNGQRVNKV